MCAVGGGGILRIHSPVFCVFPILCISTFGLELLLYTALAFLYVPVMSGCLYAVSTLSLRCLYAVSTLSVCLPIDPVGLQLVKGSHVDLQDVSIVFDVLHRQDLAVDILDLEV